PLRDLDALGRARARVDLWDALARRLDAHAVYCFTRDSDEAGVDVRSRMFAPNIGVAQDPPPGGARGPPGPYLAPPRPLSPSPATASSRLRRPDCSTSRAWRWDGAARSTSRSRANPTRSPRFASAASASRLGAASSRWTDEVRCVHPERLDPRPHPRRGRGGK